VRDPAAIHPTGLGLTLGDAIGEYATLADLPTPGIVGRLARAADTQIVYRDDSSAWQVWVTPGGGLAAPTAWVTYSSAVSGGSHAADASVTVDWTVDAANTHNDPTSESSGFITVNDTGWYTVSGTIRVAASPPSTDYSAFKRELVIFRAYVAGGDTLFSPVQDIEWAGVGDWAGPPASSQQGQSDWSGLHYLLSGDSINLNVSMYSSAGTAVSWSVVSGGRMRIEKVG